MTASELDVELYGTRIGSIRRDAGGFDFSADPKAFRRYGILSTVMSLAVPLSPRYSASGKPRRQNFFAEILPEGRNLTWLAQTARLDERDVFGLLRRFGRDVAGALIIRDADETDCVRPYAEKISGEEVRTLFERVSENPLGNDQRSGRISLGGFQTKIVLAREGGRWKKVHCGYPSTHIIKPVGEHPTMIYDEEYAMRLAKAIGLTSYSVWIEEFGGADALVAERYDRSPDIPGHRIHQEDFNQVLGASGNKKYQEFGGKVSYAKIAAAVAGHASSEDVCALASQMIFAAAIGNLDMHAKNIGVLHGPDGKVRLAPAYDCVPLTHHDIGGRMALAVGKEYLHRNISSDNIVREIMEWDGVDSSYADVQTLVREHLNLISEAAAGEEPHPKAYPKLREDILRYVSNLEGGKRAGST
ncbi:MAG: HipA domain-containing protein [Candidatus Methanoplasma sp.]|jgi:serine/threonine-protein kinase HipA|nr:HipA domain-containing protein [Candidatus Methanoplasma sp.]